MGRYSYSQPSSSSVSLWSGGVPEVTSFRRQVFRIPDKCFCGLGSVIKSSTTGENPGRMFFGCKNNKDGNEHIIKWWDEAIMEEFQAIRSKLDDQSLSIIAVEEKEESDMIWAEAEISKLKAQVKELLLPKRPRGGENVIFGGIILIVLLIVLLMYLFFSFRRSFN